MNILNKPKSLDTEAERYLKLKSKYSPEKNEENDIEENFENSKEKSLEESFRKFLVFLENNETFTWQNNLELMKVKFLC